MDFAVKIDDGHFGPRKVWHQYLPRLKYHNPTVSMTVNRTQAQNGPATMTIFFASSPDNAPKERAEPSVTADRFTTIDMKHKHESEILKELVKVTGAQEIKPTTEEEIQLQELNEERARSEIDRKRSRLDLENKRKEARLLAAAREAVAVNAAE